MSASSSFWDMQLKDILNALVLLATIFAIYVGPIKAARLTVDQQGMREREARRHALFRNLMQTRGNPLSFEHVSALNLIQIEFNKDEKVIESFKKYLAVLNSPFPNIEPKEQFEHFHKNKTDLLYDLIHEVGRTLGYNFDKRELKDLSYIPQGWDNDDNESRAFRRLVIELLSSKRALPVSLHGGLQSDTRFPPPPG